MFNRIALSLLALASFNAAAADVDAKILTSPNFELPYACAYTFTGSTSAESSLPRAVEFHRVSAVADPVLVSAPGIVRTVRDLGYGSSGRYVIVDHGGGWSTTYSNLARVDVRAHQRVEGGQRLGMIGRIGDAETTYLHYMQSKDGSPQIARFNGVWARYFGDKDYTSTTNCGTDGPVRGEVYLGDGNHGFIWIRKSPWAMTQPFGEYFNGSRVTIECQITGGNYLLGPADEPSPNGSELWYRVSFAGQKGYIPAPQVRLAYGAAPEICR